MHSLHSWFGEGGEESSETGEKFEQTDSSLCVLFVVVFQGNRGDMGFWRRNQVFWLAQRALLPAKHLTNLRAAMI